MVRFSGVRFWPSRCVPALAPCKQARIDRSVDLPAPLGPSSPNISPARTSKRTPSRATALP